MFSSKKNTSKENETGYTEMTTGVLPG